jgi:hypothetical protein
MGKLLLTIGLASLVLCAGQTARADDQDNDWQKQFQFRLEGFDEGLDKLMQGMDDLLKSIPLYQTPIINDNGDIIIRRVPRDFEYDPLQRAEEPEFADI